MAFEMQVVSHAPLTHETDAARLAKAWFSMIGYTARRGPDHGISFKLFYECFLLHPSRPWTMDELAVACGTTQPSIYRHLYKLKDFDLIEDVQVADGDDKKRGYRLRYGDLSRAWNFVESHFELAMKAHRETVDHLEKLLKDARRGA